MTIKEIKAINATALNSLTSYRLRFDISIQYKSTKWQQLAKDIITTIDELKAHEQELVMSDEYEGLDYQHEGDILYKIYTTLESLHALVFNYIEFKNNLNFLTKENYINN